jgi:hypothetical protein
VIGHETYSSRYDAGLEPPVRETVSILTHEYPAALATLVRADRASHDVARTTFREFRGGVDIYPDDR